MGMGPGLPRAVPMALMGFLLGAVFVIALRAAQSMDPIWDAQLGLLMAGFLGTVFFVWGIGAFNSKLSEHHAVEPDDDVDETALALIEQQHHEEEEAELERQPVRMLTGQIWQIAFWTLLLFAIILAFAALPRGFSIRTSNDPAANSNSIGMVPFYPPFSDQPITMNGEVVLFSEFAIFIAFSFFTLFSLAVIGGAVALGFFALSRGVTTVKAAGNVPLYALPSGQTMEAAPAAVVAKTRKIGEKARAITVPILLHFAIILGGAFGLFVTLGIFGVNVDESGIVLITIITFLLAVLMSNYLFAPEGRPSPFVVTLLDIVVFAASVFVFSILINLITSNAYWIYSPLDPTRLYLPFFNAAFITPFIVDMILAGLDAYGGIAKAARLLVITMLVFNVLYIVFYGPAIGLVVAADPARSLLSAINVALITLVLLRTQEVTWSIGKFAGWMANLLTKVPQALLGQK